MNVEKVSTEQLVYDRRFKQPNVLLKMEKCVFFGHTPSTYLTGAYRIITYPKADNPAKVSDFTKIHLDIGTWLGGGVGCFCMDTLKEYYVD